MESQYLLPMSRSTAEIEEAKPPSSFFSSHPRCHLHLLETGEVIYEQDLVHFSITPSRKSRERVVTYLGLNELLKESEEEKEEEEERQDQGAEEESELRDRIGPLL